ncbi:MAG: hypothetical protein ABL901_03195 [Hyphomicrobiaceae bacterium]
MRPDTYISIERRRYAALIDALKLARETLKWGRLFHCHSTDSYTVADKIERVLAEGREVRS